MARSLLFLIISMFSLFVYSQDKTTGINNVLESKLGSEKTKLIMHAVAELDTSFTINISPIIFSNGKDEPFLFVDDRNKLLFYIQEKNTAIFPKSVDVYSYTDVKLQDNQIRDATIPRKYAMLFDFTTSRLIRLEHEGEKLIADYSSGIEDIQINDKFVLLYDFGGDIFTYRKDGGIYESYSTAEANWNKGLDCCVYLMSLDDTSRKVINAKAESTPGNFPFFRLSPDSRYVVSYEGGNYFAYNIATGVKNYVSKNISSYFISSDFSNPYHPADNPPVWENNSHVIVKDAFLNSWELDLTGAKLPVKQLPKPEILKTVVNSNSQREGQEQFIAIEEISWIALDGRLAQGMLAKPKYFDPNKKYPIIFNYYENSVIRRNENRYGMGDLVDYDYLVFSPDIKYTVGATGNSAFNYIVSAAEYLKKLPYVDGKRMGLRGFSFGGYETNYLVTHTNLFAAAISMAGLSNLISIMGATNTGPKPHGVEGVGQLRLGATLWERPDIWIKNSPLFYSNRVTTPLLLIHSQSDDNAPFEQSLAFFKALRSLGKKVWLLQYYDVGHFGVVSSIVGKPESNCDFCTRQLQFFNHYLKGEPAPLWMLDGIPAREKSKKSDLKLDTLGRTPGPGLRREKLILTDQQKELLKHRTMVTDEGKIIEFESNETNVISRNKKTKNK
jgi:dienelactone hydrolase